MRFKHLGVGVLVVVLAGTALAGKKKPPPPPPPPEPKCPDFTIACPAVYDPVICSDGMIYGNLCEATYWGCATGCVPYGDGGPVEAVMSGDGRSDAQILGFDADEIEDGARCIRPKIGCLDIYDPVICDNGKTYSNYCVALQNCATGCVAALQSGDDTQDISVGQDVSGDESQSFDDAAGIFRPCRRKDIYCLDVWDPVICSNGQVYSNDCYAMLACATGCVPYGGETE